jgi:hypothetical protein
VTDQPRRSVHNSKRRSTLSIKAADMTVAVDAAVWSLATHEIVSRSQQSKVKAILTRSLLSQPI